MAKDKDRKTAKFVARLASSFEFASIAGSRLTNTSGIAEHGFVSGIAQWHRDPLYWQNCL